MIPFRALKLDAHVVIVLSSTLLSYLLSSMWGVLYIVHQGVDAFTNWRGRDPWCFYTLQLAHNPQGVVWSSVAHPAPEPASSSSYIYLDYGCQYLLRAY